MRVRSKMKENGVEAAAAAPQHQLVNKKRNGQRLTATCRRLDTFKHTEESIKKKTTLSES